MSTRINTNTTAFEAASNLSKNSDAVSKNIQRLSSGLRINSAADDASGLVISESLRAQSAGLSQATSNTNDAINVVKTAEGALNEVNALLIKIRQTVVHASNVGANDPTALKADADSVAAAVSSINTIASSTQFNHKNLLDGSAASGTITGTDSVTSASGYSVSVGTQSTTHASALSNTDITYDQSTNKITIGGITSGAGVAGAGGSTNFTFAANTSGALDGTVINVGLLPSSGTATIGKFQESQTVTGVGLKFQTGANANQVSTVAIANTSASEIGTVGGNSLSALLTAGAGALDLTDTTGTKQALALAVVDKAISDVSNSRETLGAFQSNVLQSNLNTLNVAQQNTDASVSTIRDTNLSAEIVDFTKNQILVQAATSALAQANQAPQAILKLLQ